MEPEPQMKKRNDKNILFRLILIVVIGFLILFMKVFYLDKKASNKASQERPMPKVAVLSLKPQTEPEELVLPSSAQAWHITPIWSRVNGYLLHYLVDIGDRVKQGDLLAEIDTPETDDLVAQAEADVRNAQAENNIAKITSDRWQKLWEKNPEAVSKQEVDQYSSNYLSSQSVLVANQKSLMQFQQQQKFKYIYAPFDGIITQRNIDIGSLIYGTVNGTTQTLFEIAQVEWIRFFVDVPQNYYRQIQDGLEAWVTIKEFPDKRFKGMVARYAKALDPKARTLLTQVNVENNEGILYAGLFGEVKFLIPVDNSVFHIPTTAMIIHKSFPHVAIVDKNSQIQFRQIEIGRDYGNELEITKGLQEGDQLVVNPSDKIREGLKVEIAAPISTSKK